VNNVTALSLLFPVVMLGIVEIVGASGKGVMLIVNVFVDEVSTPPFAVPPLSTNFIWSVASPKALVATSYERAPALPVIFIDGCVLKNYG